MRPTFLAALFRHSLLLFVLCGAVAPSQGAEQLVAIAPDVSGAWRTPDGPWDGRAVLMLHGFADDMDGAGDLSKRMAERLAHMGIASLRINFRGEGDRLRSKIESTLHTRVADTEAAYAFLSRQPGVQAGRSAALGWSLGATTALLVAGRHPQWFRSMVLWSAPSGEQFGPMTASPVAQQALRDGIVTDVVPGWKTIITRREFYESFRGVDLDVALASYPGALLSIRGSKDFLPQRDAQLLNIAPGKHKEAALIGGADHVFNVYEPGSAAPQRVLDLTAAWLAGSL